LITNEPQDAQASLVAQSTANAEPPQLATANNTFPVQLHFLLTEFTSIWLAGVHMAAPLLCTKWKLSSSRFSSGKQCLCSFASKFTFWEANQISFESLSSLYSWFRQSKYTSFQRQLNIYGSKRITCESGADATLIARSGMAYWNTCSLTTRCRLSSWPQQEC
jgi:HSF-type DNA-binding